MDYTTNHLLWLIDQGGHTADIARKILIEEQNMSIYHWMGAGWYAPRGERNTIVYYWCGDNRTQEPDTYHMGLGTPEWLDKQPEASNAVEVKLPIA